MMDEQIERLVVSVRADTGAFARDVAALRGELEGPLASGANRAGRLIETSLARALTSGKLGFDDLKRVALTAMAQIAQASLRALFNPPGQAGGGIGAVLSSALSSLAGAPGRSWPGTVCAVGQRADRAGARRCAGRARVDRSADAAAQ
jgi:hypothetical protein